MSKKKMPRTRLSALFHVLPAIALCASMQESAAQSSASAPTTPPAQICGDTALLSGPATPPAGAIVVPAGDNTTGVNWRQPGATFWLAPGVHTLGDDVFGQIIPGDGATFIGAPGAILDGQNKNRYAFTQHARNVTIRYLEIRNFGVGPGAVAVNNDEGVVNHDAGENWTIEYNYVHDNDGAGVFIGSGSTIRHNCLKDNGQYGFSSYHPEGVTNVVLDHNEVTGNNRDDWESLREGCGCTGGGKFWDTKGAVVTNNWVHGNFGTGLWADHNNADFLFEGNYIENNQGIGLFYEVSYNFMIRNNTFKRNALIEGSDTASRGNPFPTAAIYISESGGDARAGSRYAQSEITGNYFEDNWDGIALWENADRFCRPDEVFDTTNGCPFFEQAWGTRYKTQNITIQGNEFRVDRAAIGCTNAHCARMGLFSNFGTYPANSPYLGTAIQNAITFDQNNQWLNNEYHGPWRFMPFEMGRNISFASWQASPYEQDAGSTFDGDMGPPSTSEPPPPGTPPPDTGPSQNVLDAATSTLESSVGSWASWYSATVAQSAAEAHEGAHSLRVDITESFGWGVELANFPGFAVTPGTKNVSLWAKLGAGAGIQPTLTVKWLDANQATLESDTVLLSSLTSAWSETTAMLEAPAGTRSVLAYLTGGGAAGSIVYFDDIVIGDVANALDFDTAGLEGSIGQWEPWYSSSISRSTEQAHGGAHGLRVEVTAAQGWGVQLGNWPGFAAAPGAKRISYWGRGGAGNVASVTLRVKWSGAAQQLIQTDSIALDLAADWRLARADVIAPPDAAFVRVELVGGSGTAGDTLYVDDIVITDLENTLDADTASLEGAIGEWAHWYSATITRSAQAARSGAHSLLVKVTEPSGWGVHLANWPGFNVTPGSKRITYWAKRGAGSATNTTLRVKWFNASQEVVQIDLIPLALTTKWRRAAADVIAPAGTVQVRLELYGESGAVAEEILVDGIVLSHAGT